MFSILFFIDGQEFDYGVDMFQLLSIILSFSAVSNSGVVQHVCPLIPVHCPFMPILDINNPSDPTLIMRILAFSQTMM